MDEGFEQFVRDRLRKLGKGYERTRRAYTEGKGEAESPPGEGSLPVDEAGRAKLVCRRYAEKARGRARRGGEASLFRSGPHRLCRLCGGYSRRADRNVGRTTELGDSYSPERRTRTSPSSVTPINSGS